MLLMFSDGTHSLSFLTWISPVHCFSTSKWVTSRFPQIPCVVLWHPRPLPHLPFVLRVFFSHLPLFPTSKCWRVLSSRLGFSLFSYLLGDPIKALSFKYLLICRRPHIIFLALISPLSSRPTAPNFYPNSLLRCLVGISDDSITHPSSN